MNKVERIKTEFESVSKDVQDSFGPLTPEQLNWKPRSESWSVAQCLDHLIKSNEEFFPEFDKVAAGTRKNSFWESISPLSGTAGKFLVSVLQKDDKRVKTNQKMTPPSDIAADIVEAFLKHQKALAGKVESIRDAEWDKIVVTSPFMKLMTYRLSSGLQALVEHEKRHVRQAKRVMAAEGFPD
jgi:hypothetical protein